MAEKFKKKVIELQEDDEFFRKLPVTIQFTANEHRSFSNFLRSDMALELIRAAKTKVLVDHL